jgi:hypothetical protein
MAFEVTKFTTGTTAHVITTYQIVETDVGLNSGYQITVPTIGSITAFKSQLVVAGSSATVQPIIGLANGWTVDTIDHVATTDAAADFINDVSSIPYATLSAFTSPPTNEGTLFIRSQPNNAALDADVTTIIVIKNWAN